jgi:intracellular septation protein
MKIFFDLFPLLLFFAAYKLHDIYTATAVAIVASLAQVSYYWWQHRRFETMHLVTLAVIVVFGGLTLWLRDNTFIMWKPTIINWLFGALVLGSQFVGKQPLMQRLLSAQIELPPKIWTRLNTGWGVFFLAVGALNLYVAFYYAPELDAAVREQNWVTFKVWGMTGLLFLFVIVQTLYIARHVQHKTPPNEPSTPGN